MAVDDGREPACLPHEGDLLADHFAMFGGERRAGGGHDVEPLIE